MMHFNSKAMPTCDTDYSCCIEVVELVNQSYGLHIIPHHTCSQSLRGRHTHTRTRTDTHTDTRTDTDTCTDRQTDRHTVLHFLYLLVSPDLQPVLSIQMLKTMA